MDTLEPPEQGNQENVSSIPAGTYSGHTRYDHLDGWRIQLDNVPKRSAIQIHIGNFPRQTKGCILVGTLGRFQGAQGNCTLQDSAKAYGILKKAFYGTETPASTPNITVTMRIED
jgi:hypothetical protein